MENSTDGDHDGAPEGERGERPMQQMTNAMEDQCNGQQMPPRENET